MSGVGNVNNYNNQAQQVQNQNQTANQKQAEETKKNENAVEVAADEYAGSAPNVKTGNYNKNGTKVDKDAMDAVKASWKNNTGAFQKMVEGMGGNNSISKHSKDANYWSDWVYKQLGQQYTVEEAQELVADDGYWGVEQTSQRIVDMAKSLSGGDISKYDELMEAIKKGFGAAAKEFGGKMPDITSKTYDVVMEKMEAWKKEASGTTGTQTEDAVAATGAMQ